MVSIFLLYGLPNLYIQSQSLHLWCNLIMEVVSHPFYWLGGGYRSPHKYTTKKMVIHGQESLGVLLGFCLSHWPSNVSVQLPPISQYLKHYRYRQMMFKSKSKIFASILALPPLFQSSVNINPITQVKKTWRWSFIPHFFSPLTFRQHQVELIPFFHFHCLRFNPAMVFFYLDRYSHL